MGERVALLVTSAFQFGIEQFALDAPEKFRRQEIGNDHIPVAVELFLQLRGYPTGKACSARAGERMGRLQPPDMQTGRVQSPGSENGIVDEALGAGQDSQKPEWRAPPP